MKRVIMDTVKKKDQSKADREAYRNCWMIRRELGDVQGIGCVQLTEKKLGDLSTKSHYLLTLS